MQAIRTRRAGASVDGWKPPADGGPEVVDLLPDSFYLTRSSRWYPTPSSSSLSTTSDTPSLQDQWAWTPRSGRLPPTPPISRPASPSSASGLSSTNERPRLPPRANTYSHAPHHPMNSTERRAVRKRAADPDYIPRPKNSFISFRNDFVRRHKGKGVAGAASSGDGKVSLSQLASAAWRALSDEEKANWKQVADQEARDHERQYPQYRFRPVRKQASFKQHQPVGVVPSHASGETARTGDIDKESDPQSPSSSNTTPTDRTQTIFDLQEKGYRGTDLSANLLSAAMHAGTAPMSSDASFANSPASVSSYDSPVQPSLQHADLRSSSAPVSDDHASSSLHRLRRGSCPDVDPGPVSMVRPPRIDASYFPQGMTYDVVAGHPAGTGNNTVPDGNIVFDSLVNTQTDIFSDLGDNNVLQLTSRPPAIPSIAPGPAPSNAELQTMPNPSCSAFPSPFAAISESLVDRASAQAPQPPLLTLPTVPSIPQYPDVDFFSSFENSQARDIDAHSVISSSVYTQPEFNQPPAQFYALGDAIHPTASVSPQVVNEPGLPSLGMLSEDQMRFMTGLASPPLGQMENIDIDHEMDAYYMGMGRLNIPRGADLGLSYDFDGDFNAVGMDGNANMPGFVPGTSWSQGEPPGENTFNSSSARGL